MNIAVVGTGYVGLVVGTCMAETGHDVICVDQDQAKVDLLQSGQLPIYEPGLKDLFERNRHDSRLKFSTDLAAAVRASSVIFITVGTPSLEGGDVDLKFVLDVAKNIALAMDGYRLLVIKSTTPCGTSAQVEDVVRQHTRFQFDVATNPEFLKEGVAVDDFMRPDRVVIGVEHSNLHPVFERLYEPFLRTGKPILFMDRASAEMTKYAANGILALRISYMNEIANLCDALGADIDQVRKGIGADARIGHSFLFPGVGYGGSCFPKDVQALVKTAEKSKCALLTLKSADEVNRNQQVLLADKISRYFASQKSNLKGKRIALWGLAFKPRTDDMREAPSLAIIARLIEGGALVTAFDPVAHDAAKKHFSALGLKVDLAENAYDAVRGADALALVTEWNEFRRPDFKRLKELMAHAAVFDGRNIFDPVEARDCGFYYEGIGRAARKQSVKK